MKELLKEIPNEIILLSYYQAYRQVYGYFGKFNAPTLYYLPHGIPNMFEYLLDTKKQFEIYNNLCGVQNERVEKKIQFCESFHGSLAEEFEKLEAIDKEYDAKRDKLQKLWNFVTSFNSNLKENSKSGIIDLLQEGKPIAITLYDDHIFASKNLVFGMHKRDWGDELKVAYTEKDKATYDKLFGKTNPKTKN